MRYQRRYGIHTFSDNSKEQANAQIAQQLGGFTRRMIQTTGQAYEKQQIGKAEEAAKDYDPETTPVLSDRENAAGEVYNRTVLQAHQQSVDVRYKQRLMELSEEYAHDPAAFDKASQVRFDALKSELHPDLHGKLPEYDHLRFVESARLRDGYKKNAAKEAAAQADQWVETTVGGVLRHFRRGDDELALEQMANFKEEVRNTAAFGDARKNEILSDIDRLAVQEVTNYELDQRTPANALATIEAMRGDIPEQFTPEQWDSYIKGAIARTNSRSSAARKIEEERALDIGKQVSDLEIAINLMDEDTDPETVGLLSSRLDALYEMGMSDAKRTSLTVKLAEQQETINENQIALAAIVDRLGGDDSVVIDQGKVDDLWPKIEQRFSEDPLTKNAQIAQLATDLRYVPDTVKAQVRNDLRSTDTDTLFNALDLVDRIQDGHGMPDVFTTEELAYASQLETLLAYMPPEKAVEKALQSVNPDNAAMIQGRRDALVAQKLDFQDDANSRFDGWGFDLDDLNRYQLGKDYEALVENYYTAGMDLGPAKKQAERDIKNQWGKDEATGRLMRFPTQNFYSVNGDTEWLYNQLEHEVTELRGEAFDKVYLTSDSVTAREAAQGRPSYVVWGVTDQGMEPLGVRFMPDYEKEQGRVNEKNRSKMEWYRRVRETPDEAVSRYQQNLENLNRL